MKPQIKWPMLSGVALLLVIRPFSRLIGITHEATNPLGGSPTIADNILFQFALALLFSYLAWRAYRDSRRTPDDTVGTPAPDTPTHRRGARFRSWLLGGALMVLGCILLAVGLIIGAPLGAHLLRWPRVPAAVTECRPIGTTGAVVTFRFEAGLIPHYSTVLEYSAMPLTPEPVAGRYAVGTRHEIAYNPDARDEIVVPSGRAQGMLRGAATFFAVGLASCLTSATIFWRIREFK